MLRTTNGNQSLAGVCFSEEPDLSPKRSRYHDCIRAEEIRDYIRNFQEIKTHDPVTLEQITFPRFDTSKRNPYLRRRLGLSLKNDSANQKVFVFKSDHVKGVESNVKMGDSVIAVGGVRCRSLDEMMALVGYGENKKLDLLLERDSKLIDGYLTLD